MRLLTFFWVSPLASTVSAGTLSSVFKGHLRNRQSSDYDPTDLTGIKRLAAIGDSYSAGIGAGNRLGGLNDVASWDCALDAFAL